MTCEFFNEFLVRKNESVRLFRMDVIFCPEDKLWCSKEHSKLCFECLITVFVPQNNLLLQRAGKNFRSQFFL